MLQFDFWCLNCCRYSLQNESCNRFYISHYFFLFRRKRMRQGYKDRGAWAANSLRKNILRTKRSKRAGLGQSDCQHILDFQYDSVPFSVQAPIEIAVTFRYKNKIFFYYAWRFSEIFGVSSRNFRLGNVMMTHSNTELKMNHHQLTLLQFEQQRKRPEK